MSSPYFTQLNTILERLRSVLDAANRQDVQVLVYPLTTNLDGTMPAPCILVRFDGYSVNPSDSGYEARMVQSWLLEVCVRYGVTQADAQAALNSSGELVNLCISAFVGWIDPNSKSGSPTFLLSSAPKPALDNGYYYLPIGLESRKTFTNSNV